MVCPGYCEVVLGSDFKVTVLSELVMEEGELVAEVVDPGRQLVEALKQCRCKSALKEIYILTATMSSHSMTLLFSFYHIYARKQFVLGCQDADGGGGTLSQSGTVFFPLINVAQICSNMSTAALEPTAQRNLTRI